MCIRDRNIHKLMFVLYIGCHCWLVAQSVGSSWWKVEVAAHFLQQTTFTTSVVDPGRTRTAYLLPKSDYLFLGQPFHHHNVPTVKERHTEAFHQRILWQTSTSVNVLL
eukprot:TRINITY_DN32862_c0_g2_i1.p1 TRINITY_DN32862_c0_g2~~TRINITY_DN32862_c0_g2_i1.p1  ORF type:complete len:108 (-),score=6.57 TRINITY_DN32862_c0_g2_i1:350-673(-)